MKFVPLLVLLCISSLAGDVEWRHLSSRKGDLPIPGESTQQTGSLVADFDRNGRVDFVLAFRQKAPALVWYRRSAETWTRYVIEKDLLTIEAGGAVYDIDSDGDLDIVFGADSQGTEVWWWENPAPDFDQTWKRRTIKKDGARQHHDQIFADFKGTRRPQLVFWNQGAKTIFLADLPSNPRQLEVWSFHEIFAGKAGEGADGAAQYAEGLGAVDVDGDGKLDLLAGNYWFKHQGGNRFKPIRIGKIGGRIAGARFRPSRYAHIVIAPGDGTGPLTWYECRGNPELESAWVAHELLPHVVHGHSLQIGDINRDGHLDIFCAEMAKWGNQTEPDHPDSKAWIFYGDGLGNFRKTELVTGHDWHEARLADLDGDRDLDLLNKPYTWDTPRVDVWLNEGPPR